MLDLFSDLDGLFGALFGASNGLPMDEAQKVDREIETWASTCFSNSGNE